MALTASLCGCVFPTSGPAGVEILASATEVKERPPGPAVPYALLPVTKELVTTLANFEPKGLAGRIKDSRPPSDIKLGIGDVVNVSIFESASGGLFIPTEAQNRQGNFITLPAQTVDNKGNITVPYAGLIRAAGRNNVEIQEDIVAKIAGRAIGPQVLVTLAQQRTSLVSVFGEVNTPVRFPASLAGAGDRITDAITRAGGIKSQGYETWVALERNKRRVTVPFQNLIATPENNVYVQPGDQIYVYREAQKFIAFGASGQQGVFPFEDWKISLAEAVAKARGLTDNQADPESVYLFRREPRKVASALSVDLTRFPGAESVPIIFSLNFRDPAEYFLATQMQMHNRDVIFVANAASVEITKFLQLLDIGSSIASNASVASYYAPKF